MTIKRWTKEEESYLIENYPQLGANGCAKSLNRSIPSIAKKASALKLKIVVKSWTLEKEIFLMENYYELGAVKSAEMLKMSNESVRAKANRMGLSTSIGKVKHHDAYLSDLKTKNIKHIPLQTYITSHIKIAHKCANGHEFLATPDKILQGRGCPNCAKYGFDSSKAGILYYLKITKANLIYYKVGITNRTVKERFKHESKDTLIKVIHEIYYASGLEAKTEERRLLQEYKSYRQNIPELLVSGGNTELFEFDILGLDK